ncbi:hypothetical protein U9M48_027452 [Paspalum notatum var. saurae]|uniref:RING-type E3 ubiquitin transferase n=1 Tax=Paspalum notatum var. saurae TaxID=547442 RepID=A0AAQ3X042_PASNO
MTIGDDRNSSTSGGVIVAVALSVGAFLLVLSFLCSICQGYRNNGRPNAAPAAAASVLATPTRPLAPRATAGSGGATASGLGSRDDIARPRRVRPTEGLPSFTYNRSVMHNNVTGGVGGEDGAEATCSVCLGAFQAGETVRLLPVCLHLYHVECIDPWLQAHSTCPICRSGTDPALHGGLLLPPV